MVLKFSYTNKARQKRNVNNAEEVRKKSQINASRKSVCSTPFRMPIAGYRKETNCDFDCENQTVIVDNFAQYYGTPQCYVPYIDRKLRLVGKDGFPNDNFLYSHNNRLINQHKTFKQHQEVIIFEHNKDPKTNEYYISPPDVPGNYNTSCTKSKKRAITVVKHGNRQFNQYGGVTQSSRLKRIKHNAILESQSKNCVNGDMCSLYYNAKPMFKPHRLGIIPQDKGCPTYIEVKGRDKIKIQGYTQGNFSKVNFENFKTNEYINGIPLIDIGNFNISFNFVLENIYTACVQYSTIMDLTLYSLNLYYDYGTESERILINKTEKWPNISSDNKKIINESLVFNRDILINLLPFSRISENENIKFTFNGTLGSPVNFTSFYEETNVLPEIFFKTNNGKNLWWDYTYLNFDNSDNMVYVGNGLFPTNKDTTNTYINTNAYNSKFKVITKYLDNERYPLNYNQLMWNNGGFIAGQVTSYANPYINYEDAYYYPVTDGGNSVNSSKIDYSVFDNSGDDVSMVISKTSGIFWDNAEPNDVVINGRYKWFMIKGLKKFKYDSIKVTVYSKTGSELILGKDYLLYLQEISPAFKKSNGFLLDDDKLYPEGRSGWKACFKKFNPGYSLKLNNEHDAGNFITNTIYGANLGLPAYYPLITTGLVDNEVIYYRFGLKNGSNIKISNVKIEYGNNDKILAVIYANLSVDEDEFDLLNITFLYTDIKFEDSLSDLLNRFQITVKDVNTNQIQQNPLQSITIANNNIQIKLTRIVSSTESYSIGYQRKEETQTKNQYDIVNNVDFLSSFDGFSIRNTVPPQILFIYSYDKDIGSIYIKFNDNMSIVPENTIDVLNYLKSRFFINVSYYNGQTDTYDLFNDNFIDDIVIQNGIQSFVKLELSNQYGNFINEGGYYDLSYNADTSRINGFSNSVNIKNRNFNKRILSENGYPRILSGHIDTNDPRIIVLEFDRDFSDNGIGYLNGLNALNNDISFNITTGSRTIINSGSINNLKFNNYEISGNRILKLMLDDSAASSENYQIDYSNNINWFSNELNDNNDTILNDLINVYESNFYKEIVTQQFYVETFKYGKDGVNGYPNIANNVIAPAFLSASINPNNGKEIQLRLDKSIVENNSLIDDYDLSNNNNQGHPNSLYGNGGFTNDEINDLYYIDISLNNPAIKGETFDISYVKNTNSDYLVKTGYWSYGATGILGQFLYKSISNTLNNYNFSHHTSGINSGSSLITGEIKDNSNNTLIVAFGDNMKIINDGDGNALNNNDFTIKIQDPNNSNAIIDIDISNVEINSHDNKEILINTHQAILSDYLIDISYNGHCITNMNRFGFRLNNLRLLNKVVPKLKNLFIKPTDGTKIIINFDVPIYTYDVQNIYTNSTSNDLFELLTSNQNTINNAINPVIDGSSVELSLSNPTIYEEIFDISYVKTSDLSENFLKNNINYNGAAYEVNNFSNVNIDNSNNKVYQLVIDKIEVIKSHLKSSSTEIKISFLSYGESYETLTYNSPAIDDFSINTNDILKIADLSDNNNISNNSIIITLNEHDLYDLTQTYDISYTLINKIVNQKNYTFKLINYDVNEWDYGLTNSYVESEGFVNYINDYQSSNYNFIKLCKIKNQLNYSNGDLVNGNDIYSNFVVKDMSDNTLTLGEPNGYYVFYKEYSEYFDISNNTLTLEQYNKSGNHQSGWKIGHIGFNPGSTVAHQNQDWKGGFRKYILNGPFIFSEANYNIKYSSTHQNVYVEYIFASKKTIKTVEFLYGLD